MADVFTQRQKTGKTLEETVNTLLQKTQDATSPSENYALVDRLDDYLSLLSKTHQTLNQITGTKKVGSSGREWFLDNFYVVKETINLINDDLPETYFEKLPAGSIDNGTPRVYHIARSIVTFYEVDLVLNNINQFIKKYQQQETLLMCEIWALPLMLRLVLIEILTDAIVQLVGDIENTDLSAPVTGKAIEFLKANETVARSIRSLQLFARVNWKTFFEDHAQVEQILRNDPAQVYPDMDFDTRDQYRKVIEALAENTNQDETEIAQTAIDLCNSQERQRARHVGFFLRDDGLKILKSRIAYQNPWAESLSNFFHHRSSFFYLFGILLLTTLVVFGLVSLALQFNLAVWQVWLMGVLSLIPASSVGVNLLNSVMTWVLEPRILPKMGFEDGVPEKFRTMVVIPALLTTNDEVDFLLRQIELHYLANNDENIGFALLTDFADAPEPEMPEDSELLERAINGVRTLNKRYQGKTHNPFYLLHRKREWNPAEGVWMGWERKRGKLSNFNHLVLEGEKTGFNNLIGDLDFLESVVFAITVDADTIIPRESAHNLIATLAHPLNRAEFDEEGKEVVNGYTILQPRTEVKPVSVSQTPFTRIFAGDMGLDLYTRAVSDVYQDLFGEGIYVGKGIYDIAAFERSLKNKVPENALLSHDLFEGIQGRAGLVSDIVFFEDFPPDYASHISRLHRWVRGDWQLLPWLFPRVPGEGKKSLPNHFSPINFWKVLDNLRRSLLEPTSLGLLIAGWLLLDQTAGLWTLIVVSITAFPLLKDLVISFSRRIILGSRANFLNRIQTVFYRWLFWLIFLPFRSFIMMDAIVTTLVRLLISHKRLLQWQTAAHTVRLFGKERKITMIWGRMLSAPIFSIFTAILILIINPRSLWPSLPFIVVWLISPQIAFWISSRDRTDNMQPLDKDQLQILRMVTRETWLYFERFIGPDDHWLPPDHFQEDPKGLVAHRTSPTNIGLMLLSTTSAYDLGYIGIADYIFRINYTFDTLDDLEKYRGHLLNWYDTRSKKTLSPRYVSTVDSGNFAISLIGLYQAFNTATADPICPSILYQGLFDSLNVFCHLLNKIDQKKVTDIISPLYDHCQRIQKRIENSGFTDKDQIDLFEDFHQLLTEPMNTLITQLLDNHQIIDADTITALRYWSDAIFQHLTNIHKQIEFLAPWMKTWLERPDNLDALGIDPEVFTPWQNGHALQTPLQALPQKCTKSRNLLKEYLSSHENTETMADLTPEEWEEMVLWVQTFADDLEASLENTQNLLDQIHNLRQRINFYFEHMEFGFLFDQQREVFYLGYQVGSGRMDRNHYDLLASEARTASLVAIAKNEVPRSHWLHMGRPFTIVRGNPTLISWNGSMFEYLMPNLFTKLYANTLLKKTALGVVEAQINYAKEKGVPWGISESSYYRFDSADNYQYQGFGVPELGRKRGLAKDLVITPYASLMAIGVKPQAVVKNISALQEAGLKGLFGFYESVDYTKSRLPVGRDKAVIKSYMAHHQGMILVALANFLNNTGIPDRVHSDPRLQSTELLLQEQIPQKEPVKKTGFTGSPLRQVEKKGISVIPWQVEPQGNVLSTQCLSNGNLQLVMTHSGSGYLQWEDIALTRWRQDAALDNWGIWFYIQDQDTGDFWSVGDQPIKTNAQEYRVVFSAHMTEIRRVQNDIRINLQSTIPPQNDILLQKITLTNQSDERRKIRILSYGEVVLAPQTTDRRHPAFNKLFIESQYLPEKGLLVFKRRERSSEEKPKAMAHGLVSTSTNKIEFESDRKTFIGRNHDQSHPVSLTQKQSLSGSQGRTLDPIFSLGQSLTLEAHETVSLTFLTLGAENQETALNLAEKYHDQAKINHAFTNAETNSKTLLRALDLDNKSLERYQKLLSFLFYPNEELRADAAIIAQNTLGQSGLWPFGISGDYPILLVTIDHHEYIPILQDLLLAHTYWRKLGLMIDLAILNTKDTGYTHELNERIHQAISAMDSGSWLNRRGGLFVLTASQMDKESQILLKTAANAIINTKEGDLEDHLIAPTFAKPSLPPFIPTSTEKTYQHDAIIKPPGSLQFSNGIGGFTSDGKTYQIYLKNYPELGDPPGQTPPGPWINVIANQNFGFIVSESGSSFTWALNSGENRLSPWFNDPVSDPSGEALYLRDEITGKIWSPTPQPAGKGTDYLVSHSQGYSTFESFASGFRQELRLFTDSEDPVKIIELTLENLTDEARRITATYYVEWVLGVNQEMTQAFIVPDYDNDSDALLAQNTYSPEFSERVAFLTASRAVHGLTTDRREFLGFPGNREAPLGLKRLGLTSRVESGLDPCAALQIHINFDPGETTTVHFVLGQGKDREAACELAGRYSLRKTVAESWQRTNAAWEDHLNILKIETPDPAFDTILNHWLPYQALSCRIWGRSAFFQSSGAYGFRDQLQDVTSVLVTAPDIARQHILRAARHQFEAGDVLHWWHPPSGRGVRTRISDDLLWLVYVTDEYILKTGDEAILEEKIPFRQGEPLDEGEEERYGHFDLTDEAFTLFEHCRRALDHAHTHGSHNLPLIGAGDWNDGMNRVGIEGKGESVWLGWFLYENFNRFARLCELQNETSLAGEMQEKAEVLRETLHDVAWDNNWYLRAFYDDGTPLGSHLNKECQIDSLPQSWSILTGGGTKDRQQQAMSSIKEHLVKKEDQLILLFAPPFDETEKDPGYIKGYPPGIRENGGQYTHAAIWAVWAMAKLGQGNEAFEAFQILNPINHSLNLEAAHQYGVEPYVVAADIYSTPPYVGQGGWTWYTGSSGWLYRLGVEAILGFQLEGNRLRIDPCIPAEWDGYSLHYQYRNRMYHIKIINPDHVQTGVRKIILNGEEIKEETLPLESGESSASVEIILG